MSLGTRSVSHAMARPALVRRQNPICHLCDAVVPRRPLSTKTPLRMPCAPSFRVRLFHWVQGVRGLSARRVDRLDGVRYATSTAAPRSDGDPASATYAGTQQPGRQQPGRQQRSAKQDLSSLTNLMTYLENSKSKIVDRRSIPSEADAIAALHACEVVADYILDETVQPQIAHMLNQLDSSASHILSLDSRDTSPSPSSSTTPSPAEPDRGTGGARISAQLQQMTAKISETAYTIIAHPTVRITPTLLRKYVAVQARLGKPETLPKVFQLYAAKPVPREASGSVIFVQQNPHKIANAIDPEVAEKALNTAIEVKNLDAAVGIVESSYGTKAWVRSRIFRKAGLPALVTAIVPFAAYTVAVRFGEFQNGLETSVATRIAFVGILTYFGFTASLGLVAVTTANDQMKRVSWVEGIPLRERWKYEDQRAALDKVACAWGFKEESKWSEESGPDWEILRAFIMHRGMLLDDPRKMAGME